MAFTFVCHTNAVQEGGMGFFQVGRKSVLLVWPQAANSRLSRPLPPCGRAVE